MMKTFLCAGEFAEELYRDLAKMRVDSTCEEFKGIINPLFELDKKPRGDKIVVGANLKNGWILLELDVDVEGGSSITFVTKAIAFSRLLERVEFRILDLD